MTIAQGGVLCFALCALLSLGSSAFAPESALACSCGSEQLELFVEEAGAIVVATRVSDADEHQMVEFRVEEMIKGEASRSFFVDETRTSCAYRTTPGEQYLLFLYRAANHVPSSGPFEISLCAPQMRLSGQVEYGLSLSVLATVRAMVAKEAVAQAPPPSVEPSSTWCTCRVGAASGLHWLSMLTPACVLTLWVRRRRT